MSAAEHITQQPSVAQSDLTFYLCGGTGINIGVALKERSPTKRAKLARFVGLDSSDANSSKNLFPVEGMYVAGSAEEKTTGSGKVKATNYGQSESFVTSVLSKHKPTKYNIVVCNTAGGTGSMLGTMVMRALAKADQLFILCVVHDMTSQTEMDNAVGTLRSMANQTSKGQLDSAIPYLEFENTLTNTRGEVNNNIVDRLNLATLFLNEGNGEMDYHDLKHLLNYSKHYKVPAALSRIRFIDNDGVSKFEGKTPVAVASLFSASDDVIPRFAGTVIRATGVFGEGTEKPGNVKEMHMVLDHGEALHELEAHMKALDDRKIETSTKYVVQKDLSEGADGNGMFL